MIPITLEQAKELTHGTILYEMNAKNADGTPRRWKVFGKVETWKRDDGKISIPLKHGLHYYCHLTERNLWAYSLNDK